MKLRGWLPALLFLGLPALACGGPLGREDARHLLARTGFAPTLAEVENYARLDRETAVDRLLAGVPREARTPAPAWVNEPIARRRDIEAKDESARKTFQRQEFERSVQLREWWLQEMLTTPSPLAERMTLFWHNHFATGQQKVKSPQLMYRQNLTLRRHALGNFGALLHAIAKDPAMLVYLDGAMSRREQPNENFAREVMELFTLGEGHYREADIKEAARAFTGWSVEPETGGYIFRSRLHDFGTKTVLGRSGRFDGDAVLDLLLAQPACAEFIVTKLWREFISPEPAAREVQRLAQVFREANHEIKPLLRALFLSEAFYAQGNRASLVKSPVDLVIGSLRQFEIRAEPLRPVAFAVASLGQNLFSPPNVKGWPGGETWINATTLLTRKQMLDRVFRGDDASPLAPSEPSAKGGGTAGRLMRLAQRQPMAYRFESEVWLARFPEADRAEHVRRLVLAAAPLDAPSSLPATAALVRTLVLDPVYQLK